MRGVKRLALVAFGACFALARPSEAFEFLDGRLQLHGFFEQQIRALGRDLDTADDLDLAQWYHVLNLEAEFEAAPDGWGPFDLLSFFGRVEARYDCVWTRACGLSRSVNVWGDRAAHLPKRVIDQRRSGFSGQLDIGDRRVYAGVGRVEADTGFAEVPNGNTRAPLEFFQTPGFSILFGIAGPDAIVETDDDPAINVFDEILASCVFIARRFKGPDGRLDPFRSQGPWNPGCKIRPLGRLRTKPNPLNPEDTNPDVLPGPDGMGGTADDPGGSGEGPFRPAPLFRADGTPRQALVAAGALASGARAAADDAQGIFVPNAGLRPLIRDSDFDGFDQNFRQAELEWNRGASQQDEKELKELYVDLEAFDSRLWVRAGKQSIVWGKTELFRTTDQFNPQDLALASLPSLEESRIALWSVRGVWSFYSVGPFEDVRLELAFNYDQFEPADLGRCGEPFTPSPVCDKSFGLFAHGVSGVGLAGEVRPPDPWNDFEGIELGGRIEWRWGRFSFQLSDFYGYNDFPYAEKLFDYERNVDPRTGRPRRLQTRGACIRGFEPACLGVAQRVLLVDGVTPNPNPFTDLDGDGEPDRVGELDCDGIAPDDPRCDPSVLPTTVAISPEQRRDALDDHWINQTLFAMVCATSFGATNNPPDAASACGQNIFNSQATPEGLAGATLANIFSVLLGGTTTAGLFVGSFLPGVSAPFVPLNQDPGDDTPGSGPGNSLFATVGISPRLTPEQEALLGCGPYFGTHCDDDGIDLGLVETSAIMQSWPGFEGTFGDWRIDGRPQAGTEDFVLSGSAGSPCTRFEDGTLFILPGCRGPAYDADVLRSLYGLDVVRVEGDYDPLLDGCTRPDAGGMPCAGASGGPNGDGFLSIPGTDIDQDGTPNDLGGAVGQVFATEMAALSWNFLQALIAFTPNRTYAETPKPDDPLLSEFDLDDPLGLNRPDNACSFLRPQFCFAVIGLFNLSGVQRNSIEAAGNVKFGRRDFLWHSGATAVLRYERRNVLGFAMDFAEDRTKTNWGVEATWIEGLRFLDVNELDSLTTADTYNLTVSVDRPTFVNFLNPNRTFLFNSQWFFQYVDGYKKGFVTTGPFNVLATFTIFTGYSQDRLLAFFSSVYDFRSNSGGFLPQVIYRFTENFSASVGLNFFFGRWDRRPAEIRPFGPHRNRTGPGAYNSYWENGLSAIRDRDEAYLRIRYTF